MILFKLFHVVGMSSMSFFKDPQFVKWVLDADLENVRLHDSTIRGFSNRNVDIEGTNQNISLSVEKLLKSTLSVTPQGKEHDVFWPTFWPGPHRKLWGLVMHARDAYQASQVYPGSISCVS